MSDLRSCYEILGIAPEAPPNVVKKAYLRLANEWHPDRYQTDPGKRKEAEERFKGIGCAREAIRNGMVRRSCKGKCEYQVEPGETSPRKTRRAQQPWPPHSTPWASARRCRRCGRQLMPDEFECQCYSSTQSHSHTGARQDQRQQSHHGTSENASSSSSTRTCPGCGRSLEQGVKTCSCGHSSQPPPSECTGEQEQNDTSHAGPQSHQQTSDAWSIFFLLFVFLLPVLGYVNRQKLNTATSVQQTIDVSATAVSPKIDQPMPVTKPQPDVIVPAPEIETIPEPPQRASGEEPAPSSENNTAVRAKGNPVIAVNTQPIPYDIPLRMPEGMGKAWTEPFLMNEAGLFHGDGLDLRSAAFSPDGRMMATAYQSIIMLWDVGSTRMISRLNGHRDTIFALAFSPDRRFLASGSNDGLIVLWDLVSGAMAAKFVTSGGVSSISFSPNGRYIVSGQFNGTQEIWDIHAGRRLAEPSSDCGIYSTAFSPDGRRIASGHSDGSVKIRDAGSGKLVMEMREHKNWVLSIAYSPDGKRLASGGKDGRAIVWDPVTGQMMRNFNPNGDWVDPVAFSPDGNLLAAFGADGVLRIWNASTGEFVQGITHSKGLGWPAQFSPDGRFVACGDLTYKNMRVFRMLCVN